jgi:hypothetical protein
MSFPLMPFAAPFAKPPRNFFFVEGRFNASNLTTYNYTAFTAFDPKATRVIMAYVMGISGGNRTVSSVTIGGVSATLYQNVSGNPAGCLAVAELPAGTSYDIDVTFSSGMNGSAISVWQANGLDSPVPISTDRQLVVADTATLTSFQVPANGFGLFASYNSSTSTPAYTWTNAFEEYDVAVGGGDGRFSGASSNRLTLGTSETANRSATSSSAGTFPKLLIGASFK